MRIFLKQVLSLPESAKDIVHHPTTGNFFVHVCVFVMKVQNFPFGKVSTFYVTVCFGYKEGVIFLVLAVDQHLVMSSLI